MSALLWVVLVLILLWLLGLVSLGGSFVHLLLVVAVIVLIYEFAVRRRR